MSNNIKKEPKIRFPGFTNDWEQHTLLEYANFRRGAFPQPYGESKWYGGEGAKPFVQVADVSDNLKLVDTTKQTISKLAQPFSVFVPKDSVIVTLQGSIGRVALTQYDAFLDRTILYFEKYNKKIDKYFWAYIIQRKFESEALKAPGGTIKTITKEALSNFLVKIPYYEEQTKIGCFFKILDSHISFHHRRLEILQNIKKGFLQKLFPKQGETNPELRFPGFNGDWEQHTLLECANFRRGSFPQPYGESKWYGGEGAMPFVQVADVADNLKLVDTTKQTISKLAQPFSVFVPKDSVIVTLQGSIGRVALTQYDAFLDRTILYFEKYNKKIDKYFWAYIIQSKFESEALKAPGGTIKTITKEALSNFLVNIPCYEEQLKIGHFFKILDSNISFYKSNFEILQNIKKGLLQQMFV